MLVTIDVMSQLDRQVMNDLIAESQVDHALTSGSES